MLRGMIPKIKGRHFAGGAGGGDVIPARAGY